MKDEDAKEIMKPLINLLKEDIKNYMEKMKN